LDFLNIKHKLQTIPQPFYHNRFTALFLGPPGWAGARWETSGLYGAREN